MGDRSVSQFAVVYCTDGNYCDYTAVSAFSLLMNSRNGFPKIYVVGDLERDRLEASFGWMYRDGAIDFVPPGEFGTAALQLQLQLPDADASYWTKATWLRIFVPHLLPAGRLLYLDSDTVVDCDIAELARFDFGAAIVAGVRERLFERHHLRRVKKEPGTDIYLNSGVLVIDCEGWRRTDATTRIVEFQARNRCLWADQDAINGALGAEEKAVIASKYNINTCYHIYGRKPFLEIYEGGIIHYAGFDKPWCSWMNDPSQKIWQAYYDLSPLRGKDISVAPRNMKESLAYGEKMASEGRHKQAYEELHRAVRAEMKEKSKLHAA